MGSRPLVLAEQCILRHFHFAKRNELGDLQNIILIVELMGRHSTIVLVNQETGKILDASNIFPVS